MRMISTITAGFAALLSSPAFAWGYEGHEIVAAIARSQLTPAVRDKVDAILATDTDMLTKSDMLSRSTWADAWRSAGHRETAQWHFVDTEIDGSANVDAACFGHPASDQPASAGPAQDCVVDKINAFRSELANPNTAPHERLLALKYLLHFMGDLHQPLHASDNHDRGGNCVLVSLGGARTVNLHSYWDTGVVETLGRDPQTVAAQLSARITPTERRQWALGTPSDWAREAYHIARSTAYTIGSAPGCQSDPSPIPLPPDYEAKASAAAAMQLERAGVRLAVVLNGALATIPVADGSPSVPPVSNATTTSSTGPGRSAASIVCSTDADMQNLHGKERQRFRRRCIHDRSGKID